MCEDVAKVNEETVTLRNGDLILSGRNIASDIRCFCASSGSSSGVLHAIHRDGSLRVFYENAWKNLGMSDPRASSLCHRSGLFVIGTDTGHIRTQRFPNPPVDVFRAAAVPIEQIEYDDVSSTFYGRFGACVVLFGVGTSHGTGHETRHEVRLATRGPIQCMTVASRSLYYVHDGVLRRLDRFAPSPKHSVFLKHVGPVRRMYVRSETLECCRVDDVFETIAVEKLQPFKATCEDVTPVSAVVAWSSHGAAYAVYVKSGGAFELRAKGLEDTRFPLFGLEPSRTYDVRIHVDGPSGYRFAGCEVSFATPEGSAKNFAELYENLRIGSSRGIGPSVDLTALGTGGLRRLKRFIGDVGTSGDEFHVDVNVRGQKRSKKVKLAKKGDHVALDDGKNVFLPFEADGSNQRVTASLGGSTMNIEYDEVLDRVRVNGSLHKFGESIRIRGRKILITRGSLVLLFEDDDLNAFAHDGVQSDVATAGTFATQDTMCASSHLVAAKADSGETTLESSSHVYAGTTVTEIGRFECSADALVETGTASWSVLDSGTLTKVLQASAAQVDITAETITAAFDADGVHFDSNDSGIYFGTSKQFRLKYVAEDESLCFQYLSGNTYVTKAAFTDD